MNQTHVRPLAAVAGGDRAGQVSALRARLQAMEAASESPAAPVAPEGVEVEGVDTPPQLAKLLPFGGLRRRQAVRCTDCPALVVELISYVSARGGYVAVVGWPELSFAQVVEDGDMDKVIAIPDPGPQPWAVTGVLVEGLDLVIHYAPAVSLSPASARPVLAKLRGAKAALVTVGGGLPGTHTHISAEVTTYRGLGRGTGRINGLDISVRVSAKGARPAQGVISCGKRRRLEAV
ncbi:hypothetical protein [Corynebacterium flavescens]|uniref:hypothetical protein n=1 Tax=Corynebacterium flavescens TaxID=28028 RepID=UPI0026495751|nr:hypothetical protein [Corynebacterium flavescens]MDN6431989.1 hypothetical protein [Corynebacterium flavescens]MDN6475918.1 hypothetical protein [Corynebacterium flavescens]MDN6824185.1 hypothetical protein [Corynebacterium flavescens]